MSDMVERVAGALHKAEYPEGSYEGFRAHTPDGLLYERMARAAIEAMREPTETMKSIEGVHWGYSCHVCGGLTEGWKAMINKALEN